MTEYVFAWSRNDFLPRLGLGGAQHGENYALGKADMDPLTRGMVAVLSTGFIAENGNIESLRIHYWYRRPNGQSHLIHLFDFSCEENEDGIDIEDIYYKNKPLLSPLSPSNRIRARELLLSAIADIHAHIREGGSPKDILKILHHHNIPDVVGEDIKLPGINDRGDFSFRLNERFQSAAEGDLFLTADKSMADVLIHGEINTLDEHRYIEDQRVTFASNRHSGTTFKSHFKKEIKDRVVDMSLALEPVVMAANDGAQAQRDFLRVKWLRNAGEDKNFTLKALKFLGVDITQLDADYRLKVLGASYRILDVLRRRRYPQALDIMHEFGLLDLFSPIDPPPPEGRFSVVSYLGNGKKEIVEGFGFDLGACKAATYEWWQGDKVKKETVILDVGKLLAPFGSDWDGGLPDIISILKDTKAIFISHRHLDHMDALVELSRMGIMKGITVHGAPRVLYILGQKLNAEVAVKNLIPQLCPIEGEGVIHFERLSIEYSVDAMDHSTPSTATRVVARKTDNTQNLCSNDIEGSYLFYGDGRRISKRDFFARGLRSFGLDRQDTLHDLDLTNAKKPGRCPDESDAEKNLIKIYKAFPDHGILTSLISTNDRRLQTFYRVMNHAGRNFTAVGHNLEMSLRAHNIHGVDPEFISKHPKNNVNEFLKQHADQENITPVEYSGRTSQKVKGWLKGDLGRMAALVTGTQGNPGEMFSNLSRFAEGWSLFDSERPTSVKLDDLKKWVVVIDQSAIPGNHDYQRKMVEKLMRNRGVRAVIVAIDDGFRVHGLDNSERLNFIKNFGCEEKNCIVNDDGTFVITNAPIHPSGHGYRDDISDIAAAAKADLNHGTHTNDPENTTAFHIEICDKNGLRHVGRQFDDFENIAIKMGDTPEQSSITSLGSYHSSLILFKIVREFGKFFGGSLRTKRIVKLDPHHGYAAHGLFSSNDENSFEQVIPTHDFEKVSNIRRLHPVDKTDPPDSVSTIPDPLPRYRAIQPPRNGHVTARQLSVIDSIIQERFVA
jgi:mRNA degradation ribonuclease J1/J2